MDGRPGPLADRYPGLIDAYGGTLPGIAAVTADQLVAAYRRWHVQIVERPGWRTRNTGRAFDPIGVVVHHDAMNDGVSTARGLDVIEGGRTDLAGPLSNVWHEDDGTAYLTAFGNANHGGRFAAEPVDRTRAGLAPRGDALALGLVDDGPIANGLYYGDEVHNAGDGRDPYEPGQMQTLTLSLAARCELHGWTGARVIAHREGTRRKIDPRGIDMAALRDAVDVCLFVGPDNAHPTQEGFMAALNEAEQRDLYVMVASMLKDNFAGGDLAWLAEGVREELQPVIERLAHLEANLDGFKSDAYANFLMIRDDVDDPLDVEALAARLADGLGAEVTKALGEALVRGGTT